MEDTSRPSVQLSFPFTWWDRVKATFILVPERRATWIIHSVFPLVGLAFLGALIWRHQVTPYYLFIVLMCLLFTPLCIVVGVTAAYLTNPALREPFTYSFDDAGIHVHASTYEYTHKWAAISKVKRSAGYLLFFFSGGNAHCIPVIAVDRANAKALLVRLAVGKGVKVAHDV
jgi:hypothetical protein